MFVIPFRCYSKVVPSFGSPAMAYKCSDLDVNCAELAVQHVTKLDFAVLLPLAATLFMIHIVTKTTSNSAFVE